MSKIKFLCNKMIFSEHETGKIISEITYNPPQEMDFGFPTNVDMNLNDVRCGTYTINNCYNQNNYALILKRRLK